MNINKIEAPVKEKPKMHALAGGEAFSRQGELYIRILDGIDEAHNDYIRAVRLRDGLSTTFMKGYEYTKVNVSVDYSEV